MPSSYTLSLRLTLQATGENNNTWGAILNSGVFGLVDYAVAGVLSFALSGTKNLTTALGATDEARAAMLDISGGAGGNVIIPPVSKGYFVRNASAGLVQIAAGGAINGVFNPGDIGPVFCDGSNTYPLMLSGKGLYAFIVDADQEIINYVNLAISQGSISLPPVTPADIGKALMVIPVGASAAWSPRLLVTADIAGLDGQLAAVSGLNAVLARAFYGDLF